MELGIPRPEAAQEGLYAAYRECLKRYDALDFDDLLAGAVRLLAASPGAATESRARYRAVFVDEYQDVNYAQYALVRLIAPGPAPELFVIGDPDQAIYGFRGADSRFIERFATDYPGAAVYRLEKSFRCAPSIIGAANELVGAGNEGTGRGRGPLEKRIPQRKIGSRGDSPRDRLAHRRYEVLRPRQRRGPVTGRRAR